MLNSTLLSINMIMSYMIYCSKYNTPISQTTFTNVKCMCTNNYCHSLHIHDKSMPTLSCTAMSAPDCINTVIASECPLPAA